MERLKNHQIPPDRTMGTTQQSTQSDSVSERNDVVASQQDTAESLLSEAADVCRNEILSSFRQGECVFTNARLESSRFDGYKTYWVYFSASGEWGMGRKCLERRIQCRANKMANGNWQFKLQ